MLLIQGDAGDASVAIIPNAPNCNIATRKGTCDIIQGADLNHSFPFPCTQIAQVMIVKGCAPDPAIEITKPNSDGEEFWLRTREETKQH
ncbi:hypothetical protein GCM10009678_29040 [Actinomadura kijaniata]